MKPTLFSPRLLAELAGVSDLPRLPDACGVSFHSAQVRPGDAFFALPGAAQHGLAFAEAALRAGAAFIVSDRPHPRGLAVPDPAGLLLELGRRARRELRGPVIGITGSAGKTGSRALIAAALGAYATPGNFNTPLALARTLIEAWLAGRTGANARLVLELGIDHPGEMDTLLALTQPTLAVLTLIAPGHLSGLGSVENVAREKLKLVSAAGHAFISAQAATFLPVTARATRRGSLSTYGLEGGGITGDGLNEGGPKDDSLAENRADVIGRLSEISTDAQSYGQTLAACGVRLRLPFVGAASAENAVAALALAAHLGDDLVRAATQLENAPLEPGRLQPHRLGSLTLLDDSYNSNPASASAALAALAHFPRPHTAVFGDMLELGAESGSLHRELGVQTRTLERVIAVGAQTRHLAAANPEAVHVPSFDLGALLPLMPSRGTLLVKGSRGMRLERLVEALIARAAESRNLEPQTEKSQVETPTEEAQVNA